MTSRGRELENPDVRKLKDWHPATRRNMYSADDPNVDSVNPALPDGPATKVCPLSLMWRQILSRPRRRLGTILWHMSQQTDPKEGRHRAAHMMSKLGNSDWVFGLCLVSDLDL